MAFLTMVVAASVAHGALRPMLEARGVRPWRFRDTLATIPLVLTGSAGIGGTGGLLSAVIVTGSTANTPVSGSVLAGTTILGSVSLLLLLLGILALRKLS